MPDGTQIEYVHDPLGRRIAKKVSGTVVEKYLWQGMTRLLAVYDGSDNLLMRFKYADGMMPVAMTAGGATYYLGYDQVGTLKAVADASGNVVRKIAYDSFGNIIEDTNPAFVVPFGFAGGLHDRDIGLVRFGYRDYDPDTGRWTAKDPILFAGGDTDLYGYCLDDPINKIDSEGLMELPSSPDGLGPEWKIDPNHYNPNNADQIRFRDPSGRVLDWHPGDPNVSPKKWEGQDHWHDPENFGKKHLKPGTEIPDPSKPPLRAPRIRGPLMIIICPECIKKKIDELTGACKKNS